ncbi:hypothetical protein AB0M28_20220 [Streptomyces sp. NPDC051940]|uniref:DUF4760 domain-containing protein n=1 Tax=Streptomyces sp. NPDC051940 TaxID=3155675 RepID=UPI003413676A
MEIAALVVSLLALGATGIVSARQLRLTEHANTLPVLVDLFREHRSVHLALARETVFRHLPTWNISAGMEGLPEAERNLIRDLAWFYDNLGALVAHGVVGIRPVSGYLGGSVISVWEQMEPLVRVERAKRSQMGLPDPDRWQEYFENLYHLVRQMPPPQARAKTDLWRLPTR